MGDSKELKPKSFRIDDATADKFKEISSQIGGNQQETLAKLIEAYEFQGGKAILTDKKADIEQFERYTAALIRMYMGSLEDNQNLTATIRTEFEGQLKSKDSTIQDLQEKVQTLRQAKLDAEAGQREAKEEQDKLYIELAKADRDSEEAKKSYEDKIKGLNDTIAAFKDSVDSMKKENVRLQEGASVVNALKEQIEQLKADLAAGQKSLEDVNRSREQDSIKHEREIMALEKKYAAEKQVAVDQYQAKYLELLEKLQADKDVSPRQGFTHVFRGKSGRNINKLRFIRMNNK